MRAGESRKEYPSSEGRTMIGRGEVLGRRKPLERVFLLYNGDTRKEKQGQPPVTVRDTKNKQKDKKTPYRVL